MTPAQIDALLIAYIQGDLSPTKAAYLERELLSQPELAQRLMILANDEATLVSWARRANELQEIKQAEAELRQGDTNVRTPSLPPQLPPKLPSPWPNGMQWPNAGWIFLALMVVGVAGYFGYAWWTAAGNLPGGPPIAFVQKVNDAKFGAGHPTLRVGTGIPAGWSIQLEQGELELVGNNGVTLSLRGSTIVKLRDALHSELQFGQVTADVPHAVVGYTVDTPTVAVLDKGTRFGVRVNAKSGTEVHVFDGAVETQTAPRGAADKAAEKQSLTMTQAVRFDTTGRLVDWIDPAYEAFGSPHLAPGIVKTSNNVRWVKQLPPSLELDAFTHDDNVYLILERKGVALPGPLAATFQAPLSGTRSAYKTNRTMLPKGLKVDSYLLHFNPQNAKRAVSGDVVFDRPVLAVMARGDHLHWSDKILGSPAIKYESQDISRRGLLGSDDKVAAPDVINFGKSPNSVGIHCAPRQQRIAEVRILVQCE